MILFRDCGLGFVQSVVYLSVTTGTAALTGLIFTGLTLILL